MPQNWLWILGFLALYGLHAVFYLVSAGTLDLSIPVGVARPAALVTLVGLTVLVVVFVVTRDEVIRRWVLQASGVSLAVTALLSYALTAFDIPAPYLASNLWAFAIAVFLLAYGVLTWLAKS